MSNFESYKEESSHIGIDVFQISAIGSGVRYFDPDTERGVEILSPDVPVVILLTDSRPEPSPYTVPLAPIKGQITGVAYNIYNNIWNTNFIFYYPYHEEDKNFRARFAIRYWHSQSNRRTHKRIHKQKNFFGAKRDKRMENDILLKNFKHQS